MIWEFINLEGRLIPYQDVAISLSHELYNQIKYDIVDPDGNVSPFMLYHIGLTDKIRQIEAEEVWNRWSFRNEVSSYGIYYGNDYYSSGVLPKKMKQSNNRGELMVVCLGLTQTKGNNSVTFYTDSQYTYEIANWILRDKDIPRTKYLKNRDIIDAIKLVIDWRTSKSKKTAFQHVNSHLLDSNAKIKVKKYDKKLGRMKALYGDDCERILKGNQRADRLTEQALSNMQPVGFVVNSQNRKWLIWDHKNLFDDMDGFMENTLVKRAEEHRVDIKKC